MGGEALKQYNHIIDKIIALLTGKDISILEDLEKRMVASAEKFNFEAAQSIETIWTP